MRILLTKKEFENLVPLDKYQKLLANIAEAEKTICQLHTEIARHTDQAALIDRQSNTIAIQSTVNVKLQAEVAQLKNTIEQLTIRVGITGLLP